jgi:choline kinase
MNIVFLAAGKSSRIYSKIKKNKCLIELNKKSIISKIIDSSKEANIKNIHVVVGFNKNKLKSEILKIDNKIKFIYNKHFFDREMTYSMICALKKMKGDTIISYSDIIYNSSILKKLTKKKFKNIVIPLHSDWEKIWKQRNKNIYEDAEMVKCNKNQVLSIGQKIKSEKPKYQYMGIVFIPEILRKKIIKEYANYNNHKIQLTGFINSLILNKVKVEFISYKDSWFEFDDIQDLKRFNNANNK